jgi:hypothetical protein
MLERVTCLLVVFLGGRKLASYLSSLDGGLDGGASVLIGRESIIDTPDEGDCANAQSDIQTVAGLGWRSATSGCSKLASGCSGKIGPGGEDASV